MNLLPLPVLCMNNEYTLFLIEHLGVTATAFHLLPVADVRVNLAEHQLEEIAVKSVQVRGL